MQPTPALASPSKWDIKKYCTVAGEQKKEMVSWGVSVKNCGCPPGKENIHIGELEFEVEGSALDRHAVDLHVESQLPVACHVEIHLSLVESVGLVDGGHVVAGAVIHGRHPRMKRNNGVRDWWELHHGCTLVDRNFQIVHADFWAAWVDERQDIPGAVLGHERRDIVCLFDRNLDDSGCDGSGLGRVLDGELELPGAHHAGRHRENRPGLIEVMGGVSILRRGAVWGSM